MSEDGDRNEEATDGGSEGATDGQGEGPTADRSVAADETLDADRARHELYAVLNADAPFERKVEQAFELAEAYLDVDNAHLTRIDREADHWEAVVSTDPADGQFPPGLTLDLGETYCRRTLAADGSIALHDAPSQGWADDPAFRAHGLHCYHGTTVEVDGEPYGTVCFVAEEPRSEPFSEEETLFAELLARMVERELQRRRHEMDTRKRANLVTVLSRVLRHNLRNEMTVVRGRIRRLIEQSDDVREDHERVLSTTDKVLALSEKARKLEQVVGAEFERTDVDLPALVRAAVESVESDYPDASIVLDLPDAETIPAMPTLEDAVRELVENAVEHAGDEPRVRVAVESSLTEVEIHVTDDGPGLPSQERQVLEEGVETPLVHGSGLGLWMAHWVVSSHDGTIETDVSEDGTCMTVVLPRDAADPLMASTGRERELQRGYDRYRAAFQESFDAMLLLDDDARILDANPAAADLCGTATDDLLGRPLSAYLSAEFPFEDVWETFLANGHDRRTATVVPADDSECRVEYTGVTDVVPDQHLLVARDVTDRERRTRALETTTQTLRSVVETVPVAIFVKDAEGRYQLLNREAREVLGVDPDRDVEGLTDDDLFSEEVAARHRADDRRVLQQGEPIETEEEVSTADGTRTYLTVKAPFFDESGTPLGVCGVATDVTDHVEREQLERRTERLEELASIVGHDLRNPLQVATSRLEMAREEVESDHLDVVARAHDRMLTLVDDLLTLARQGEEVTEAEPLSVAQLAQRCWQNVETREATLDVEADCTVEANRSRLQELFENLTRNAVEHGGDDVTVTVGELDDGFYVADDGPGIPEDEREQVFEAGYSTGASGTGLGLYIVRQICDAHGWTVSVTDADGGGARFEIRTA